MTSQVTSPIPGGTAERGPTSPEPRQASPSLLCSSCRYPTRLECCPSRAGVEIVQRQFMQHALLRQKRTSIERVSFSSRQWGDSACPFCKARFGCLKMASTSACNVKRVKGDVLIGGYLLPIRCNGHHDVCINWLLHHSKRPNCRTPAIRRLQLVAMYATDKLFAVQLCAFA